MTIGAISTIKKSIVMLKPRSVLIVIMHPVPIKIWGNFEEI